VRWLAIALLLVAATPARADDDLAEARRLEAALEYDKALTVVEHALARGGSDPARVAELHLLAGRLAAGLDRAAVAEDHYARALALRPDTRLPDGTSPRLTAPFDAARARGVPPLDITATVVRGLVTIAPKADPLGLVVGVQAHVVDRNSHYEVSERGSLRVIVPPGATTVEVAALDANGNRVWVGPAPAEPVVIEPPRIVLPPPPPHRSIAARWQTWTIAGGAIAIAGGAFAWKTKSLQDEWNRLRAEDGQHDFSALQAIETRGRRYAIAADVSFGVAAAAGITAAILAITARDEAIVVTPTTVGIAKRF
jgi:hypothetical protein